MWRGTTVQVCGLWPWHIAAGTPLVGAPMGPHQHTGAAVCFDPISWFQAGLLANPSMFVLSLPGRGKSTMVRHMLAALAGFGVMPLVLGDLKPDYTDLVAALGGQVIPLGPGRGHLNVLDASEALAACAQLEAAGAHKLAGELRASSRARRLSMLLGLLTIVRRGAKPADYEETLLRRALEILDDGEGVPRLADLLAVVRAAPEPLRAAAEDQGDLARYTEVVRPLVLSLGALTSGGELGEVFAQPTSSPMRRDRPVCYDISGIPEAQTELVAACLLACWSNGFGVVDTAHALVDAGLEPERHYMVVMDELWRALRAGHGMVDRIDATTRLNRTQGVGVAMISHTMSDLLAIPNEADQAKARGLVERAGAVVLGALPAGEMPLLRTAVPLVAAEQDELVSWAGREAWSRESVGTPPGLGRFMVKVGGRPGIPFHVQLTDTERDLNDTNQRWHVASRIGDLDATVPGRRAEES